MATPMRSAPWLRLPGDAVVALPSGRTTTIASVRTFDVELDAENRTTGSFILVDEATNETVGAGMAG